jgi:hypothetical protein
VSALGDAVGAIRSVLLMQTNLERLERVVERQDQDIGGLREAMTLMNNRLIRIETMIEMSTRASQQPRIEQA